MKIANLCAALAVVAVAPALSAQAVPEASQANKIPIGYRRAPLFDVDPFRNVMIPKWGLVVTVGGSGRNNTLNLSDIGAINYLTSDDNLRAGDVIDALTLVPEGEGIQGFSTAESGAYIGLSLGERFMLGISAAGRAYGVFQLDDDAVALLRDGNAARQDFSLGNSGATALSTGELGAHSLFRTGAIGSPDGVQLAFGVGLRYLRTAAYFDARSVIANGGTVRVTGDSVSANLAFEINSTLPLGGDGPTGGVFNDIMNRVTGSSGGTGSFMGDLLVRAEWPTSGFALEGMMINLGASLSVNDVARRTDTLFVQTTQLDDFREELDDLNFDVRDTVDLKVSIPRIWRVTATSWANTILQLDGALSGSWGGDFDMPVEVAVNTTWRLIRHVPLRAGVVLGGRQGIGYQGGLALESQNFLFRMSAQSLGGWMSNATGVGARLDLGFFF